MKILAISDTHNDFFTMQEIVRKNLNCDMFLHAGDGCRDFEDVSFEYPTKQFIWVRGNCDYDLLSRDMCVTIAQGKRILLVHGHVQGAKHSIDGLKRLASENKADIVIYGHSHKSKIDIENGVFFVNPGSPVRPRGSDPSYALIEITDDKIDCKIVTI